MRGSRMKLIIAFIAGTFLGGWVLGFLGGILGGVTGRGKR